MQVKVMLHLLEHIVIQTSVLESHNSVCAPFQTHLCYVVMFSNGALEYCFHGNMVTFMSTQIKKLTGGRGGHFLIKMLDVCLTNYNIFKINEFSRFI